MNKEQIEILGTPIEQTAFSTFSEFTAYERQMIMAELYHNAWYNQERFEQLYDLFNYWEQNPIKEKKFLKEESLINHE
jgi:hypothetical protein